ncbi:MAG: sulfur oxidation c-type cytochrome SoxA [Rhodocyclaceae bacterium]|jgi:sulfur-oxidizing protein SoxA|nr:sulfur oxidation c-type cytochrome SoxA [Rhodocyclaceae bacterium]MCA3081905.1 sulfur oxidation c-type cytochrome SoxA [Rhodocyclaceae bacterium]MCE2722261.1 sulfur oxidation c-type cytochrome SoxA [Betaproteobacteria bacterium]
MWFELTRCAALVLLGTLGLNGVSNAQSPAHRSPAGKTNIQAATESINPERDRTTLTAIFQKKFPGVPPDEWSHGGATFAPGVSVIPLGGNNATNVNDILAIGKKTWARKFRSGKSLSACFPNGGQRVAANYPQVEPKSGTLVTLEDAVNACLVLHQEPPFRLEDDLTMGAVSAYLRSLSNGQKLNVRVAGPAALEHYVAGRRWFSRRIGERDLACASCHVLEAGRTQTDAGESGKQIGFSPAVGQVLAWPRIEPGGAIRSIQKQFQRCFERAGAAPFELGSVEYKQLEYFLSAVSNGLTIRPPMPAN